ncbi:MAG TPA: hypothetical protein VL485_25230 [Ktedonobacteraceae bacterium]|jgi:hypothetical protein|nr:hypothetical protein [Ktedonobacteraceae bacterium]
MNIWDSVHRGLEKASHEAARIAKSQKLRSQIDGLARQIGTQRTALINRTMDLYTSNQLTQSQLLPVCNELASLQQQLEQAQNELKQIQSQGPQPAPLTPLPPTNITGTYQITSPYPGGDLPPTIPAPPPPPPDYTNYQDHTTPVAPPPGNTPPTISMMETRFMETSLTPPPPPSTTETIRCIGCQGEIVTGLAYCPNCGRSVQASGLTHLPTMRGGALEPYYPAGQETVRGEATNNDERVTEQNPSLPGHIADQETIRSDAPPSATQPKD